MMTRFALTLLVGVVVLLGALVSGVEPVLAKNWNTTNSTMQTTGKDENLRSLLVSNPGCAQAIPQKFFGRCEKEYDVSKFPAHFVCSGPSPYDRESVQSEFFRTKGLFWPQLI